MIELAMARGWESKSVEGQQADAERSSPREERPPVTPRDRQRAGLELARVDLRRRLSAATDPRQVKLLEQGLAGLDARLRALD